MKKLSIFTLFMVSLPVLLLAPMAAQSAGVLSLSQTYVNVAVGQNATVNAYPLSGQIVNQTGNSNTYAALANVSNNVITIYGVGSGSTQMTFCTYDNICGTIFVTIGGGSNFTNITFSQNPVSLNFQQSTTVTVYGNSSSGFNFYVSSNSNPGVVTASISGSSLYLYGQMQGSSSIVVCQTNNSCGTITVTVGYGSSGGTLSLSTTTLPQYTVNQYYFSQLAVSGGSSPYNFSLASGTLPPGISLGSAGQVAGTAASSGTYGFSVRVTDNFGRAFYGPTLTLSSGAVLGSQTYNNGTLVNDNGTIHIAYKNLKSAFANMPAFRGLGYSLGNVIVGSTSSLFSSGFVVGSSNIAHPWGSWVKSGTTVYFVHETGLVPISSYDIFLNNGGPAAGVVKANSYDLMKPLLSVMSYNDTRLK